MKKLSQWVRFLSGFIICLNFLGAMPSGYALSASFPKTDEVITAQLEAVIAADPVVNHFKIQVDTLQAVVSLRGQVDTIAQANYLVILANAIAGVHAVDAVGLIVKKNNQPLSTDNVISSEVIGLYVREGFIDIKHLSSAPIQVNTQEGIVYLSGTVATEELATRVCDLAQTIPGVVAVQSALNIAQQ